MKEILQKSVAAKLLLMVKIAELTCSTSCFIAITVRWAILKLRLNPDFYVVGIAHPTIIENGTS
jgi:hypothetical protein